MTTTPLTPYHTMVLRALQDKPLYLGTVRYTEKLRRRAAGKRAKQARKRKRGR